MGRWLSDRVRDRRSRQVDTCRSRTIGQIDVGGRICTRCSPRVHSGLTWEAHRLCNCKFNSLARERKKSISWIDFFRSRENDTHRHLTPTAMESGDSVVGLDRPTTFWTLGVTIAFDPMMSHNLCRFFRLDVRADARSRRPLNASFVYRILAN